MNCSNQQTLCLKIQAEISLTLTLVFICLLLLSMGPISTFLLSQIYLDTLMEGYSTILDFRLWPMEYNLTLNSQAY
jgi:hypothetical protein